MEVAKEIEKARQDYKRHKKGFSKLRARPPKDLDERFHDLHEEVFSEVDCLDCANCCKTTSPIFRDIDIDRLAKHLNIRPAVL
ncbi:MAG: YkgJ family cysteine cluster protein, partial [Bacteroidota bacterium]